MYARVFARSDSDVPPAALAAHLHAAGLPVEPHFRGDDLGWTAGELRLPGADAPVTLDRYLAAEDDLRDDLNAHAARLEARGDDPHAAALMEHVALAKQLVVVRPPPGNGPVADQLVTAVCQFLSASAEGVYQVDGRGWFAADGAPLLADD